MSQDYSLTYNKAQTLNISSQRIPYNFTAKAGSSIDLGKLNKSSKRGTSILYVESSTITTSSPIKDTSITELKLNGVPDYKPTVQGILNPDDTKVVLACCKSQY